MMLTFVVIVLIEAMEKSKLERERRVSAQLREVDFFTKILVTYLLYTHTCSLLYHIVALIICDTSSRKWET